MEKSLDKLPQTKEKIQLSCSWRLIDMFGFKNGGSSRNQKLLTNGRPKRNNVLDAGDPRKVDTGSTTSGTTINMDGRPRLEMHDDGTFDIQVQNLLRKETKTENSAEKCKHNGMELKKGSVFNQLQKNYKKASKHSKRTPHKPMRHVVEDEFLQSCLQSLSSTVTSLDKHIIAEMLEEVYHQMYQENSGEDIQRNVIPLKHYQLDHVKMQLLQTKAKAFIDQIYINRKFNSKNDAHSESKQFLEAADVLKLNMDLFLKLLQDPYSPFVKNVKNLQFLSRGQERTKLLLEHKPSGCQNGNVGDSQDPESMNETSKKDANNYWTKKKEAKKSRRIVILKPESKEKQSTENVACHCSSLQAHHILKNKGQIKRATFLSLVDIKRKFRQAVGTNQKKQRSFLDKNLLVRDKKILEEGKKKATAVTARGMPTLSPDVPVDLTLSNETPVDSLTETVDKKINTSLGDYSKQGKIDIFSEAKRHLSERLKTADLGESLPRKETPRTLKMILSSRDMDLLESDSHRGHDNHVSAHRICCSYRIPEMTKDSSLQNKEVKIVTFPRSPKQTEEASSCSNVITPVVQKQKFEIELNIPDSLNAGTGELENISSITDDHKPSDFADGTEANDINGQGNETTESHIDSECMERLDLGRDDDFSLDSSSPLDIYKLQIVENIVEKEDYRSPVSVLEPFCFEEGDSPPRMISGPAESKLRPRCLSFEEFSSVLSSNDHEIEASTCINEVDSLSLYVRAVIQVSGLNFDEFSLEGTLHPDVLHSYINDEVRPMSSEVDCDMKLLLDCVHEVIIEVYQCYFRCSPWISFLRPKLKSAPIKENFIDEVVKEVNYYALPKNEQPTLDQLARNDIAKSSSWLDLCNDTEDILNQLAEDFLYDSILDTIVDAEI